MRCSLLLAFLLIVSIASAADAQTAADRGYAGVKFGGNIEEAEDGISGRSLGRGADGAVLFNRFWGLEGEFWIPAFFESRGSSKQHRDILFNVSAVRFFGETNVRPFIAFGLGFGQVEERNVFGPSYNSTSYAVFGGGVQVPIGSRFAIVPELRVNYAITALIVRPIAAARVRF